MHRSILEPPRTEPYLGNGTATSLLPWAEATRQLTATSSVWFATTTSAGRPHVVPVLTVVVDGVPYVSASPVSRKVRNLAREPHCVLTARVENVDIVIEGVARRVMDDDRLQQVAAAYAQQHGWPVEVRDCAFHADGAPTAGLPPYHVFEITPIRGFAFPQDGQIAPTRWRFEPTAPAGR